MKHVDCQSPTRVDLAGGTLDLWPLYLLVDTSYTINFAIDINTRAELKEREDGKIVLESRDRGLKAEFNSLEAFLADDDEDWCLVKQHINYWKPEVGFELMTDSQSPVGGGLGGSSSLSISIIKAFSEFSGRQMSAMDMVDLAGNVEAQILKTPTGTQDYFPPIHGGMNVIYYGHEGKSVEVLEIPSELFAKRFFLVYTGRPHNSGLNNWSVMKEAIEGNKKTLGCLNQLKGIADEVKTICENKAWEKLGPVLKKEFEARVGLCAEVSSPEIEKLESVAIAAGAEAVKICGAGGGGCAMVWSSEGKIDEVKKVCSDAGFEILNVNLVPAIETH